MHHHVCRHLCAGLHFGVCHLTGSNAAHILHLLVAAIEPLNFTPWPCKPRVSAMPGAHLHGAAQVTKVAVHVALVEVVLPAGQHDLLEVILDLHTQVLGGRHSRATQAC